MQYTISLNEDNPLGLSYLKTGELNMVHTQDNLYQRSFWLHPGDGLNAGLLYRWMIEHGYKRPPSPLYQMIDAIIAKDEAALEYLHTYYYALAGGADGGMFASVDGDNRLNINTITNEGMGDVGWSGSVYHTAYESYPGFNPENPPGTVDTILYFISQFYHNGAVNSDYYEQGGVLENPYNVSFYGAPANNNDSFPMMTLDDVMIYGGDDIWANPYLYKRPNLYSVGGEPYVPTWYQWADDNGLTPDKDPYEPGGYTTPDGGNGEVRVSVNIPQPELPPEALLESGIIQMYSPSSTEMKNFMNYIYSAADSFITNIKKIWVNPMDSIISFSIVPFDVSTEKTDSQLVKFCGISTDVSMTKVKQFKQFDFGDLHIPRETNSALDYANFTKVQVNLPFIGIQDLETDDVMDADLNLVYNVDLLSGDCIASILCRKKDNKYNNKYEAPLYQFKGNVILNAPVTGNNFASFYGGVANLITKTAAAVGGGGGALGIADAASQFVLSEKANTQRSGSMTGNSGQLGNYIPYVIIESPIKSTTEGMYTRQGYPANVMTKLSSLENGNFHGGYAQFMKGTVIVDQMESATDREKEAIKQLLESGIIFNKPE
jgi:hypothetical protein